MHTINRHTGRISARAAPSACALNEVMASPPRSTAKMNDTNAMTIHSTCNGLRCVSTVGVTCRMEINPNTMKMTSSANVMTKIQRHGMNVPTRPPTVGPRAGAVAQTRLPMPMSMPILDLGDCSRMMLNISGNAIPVPAPCSTRAESSIGKLSVHAANRLPARHRIMAIIKIVFIAILRLKYEESGVTNATTNR
ncbi:hypothetical protein D2E23_2263 [Bifidobacterium callimiconis]|uniref:Uncharacterized protein n=1 Tax=Bifidobacterium callimiconis TaxID=2306973 RepID=A0A430F6D6_9BIFI|nr:hypothetical protein D2E23_2263 [Bifidobacterium callimiconis]